VSAARVQLEKYWMQYCVRAPRKRRGIGGNVRDPAAIDRDSELDQAVRLVPKIYDVMRQAPSDPASTEPFQELLDVIKTAIG
jgi:hypothetical protein